MAANLAPHVKRSLASSRMDANGRIGQPEHVLKTQYPNRYLNLHAQCLQGT